MTQKIYISGYVLVTADLVLCVNGGRVLLLVFIVFRASLKASNKLFTSVEITVFKKQLKKNNNDATEAIP